MKVNVLIYEDNDSLRQSVVAMLEWNGQFKIAAAFPDASNVKEDITTITPQVVLMDIDMPNSNGVTAVKEIRTINPDLPVIMFTVFEDNDNIFNAICAGANGYILKKNFEQIPAAITDVLNGGAPMTSSVAKKVLGFVAPQVATRNHERESLTTRETEILDLLVKGYSYKMIAAQLVISIETVRSHIKKVYKKLQVNSATEAVYKASQQ